MTTIRTFTERVKAEMTERLNGFEVSEQTVVKLNDNKLLGLVARRKGENAGATVYMNEAYDHYCNGGSIDEIVDELVSVIQNAELYRPVITDRCFDLDFESIKDNLTVRLVDTELNREYLKEHPYREIGAGLAIVIDVNMSDDYSFVINNGLAENYDIDLLFNTALANMETKHPAILQSMESALFGGGGNALEDDKHIEGMYTLMLEGMTNFGASVLAYKGVAERILKLFGSSFFILPSSLHEIILIADDGNFDADNLKNMVTQANKTVVDPADVLSDSVFYYGSEGLSRVA